MPPGITVWRDLGSPGEQFNASYFSRISPVMCRLALIHTRSSRRPSAARSADPLIDFEPFEPRTMMLTMRPETPRSAFTKSVTVPMRSESCLVIRDAVYVTSHVALGFADV